MSLQNPIGEPWNEIRADSPPLLPPGVKLRLTGFRVLPQTLLMVSYSAMVWATLVLASKTAPDFLTANVSDV